MGMRVSKELEAKILAQAGPVECRGLTPPGLVAGKPKPGVLTSAPRRLEIVIDVPIRLKSEANTRGSARAYMARKLQVRGAVAAAVPMMPIPLPAVVTLTRFGGSPLDEDDNLPAAFKWVKDVIAEWLGVADTGRDPRIHWRYQQRAAWVPFCRVRIVSRPTT